MYEHHTEELLPRRDFIRRLARHVLPAVALLVISLAFGTVGFHWLGPQQWVDAFLNAAMLLGGMGLVSAVERSGGKIFAAFYALYSGVVFLVAAALLLAPVLHRAFHRLHLAERRGR